MTKINYFTKLAVTVAGVSMVGLTLPPQTFAATSKTSASAQLSAFEKAIKGASSMAALDKIIAKYVGGTPSLSAAFMATLLNGQFLNKKLSGNLLGIYQYTITQVSAANSVYVAASAGAAAQLLPASNAGSIAAYAVQVSVVSNAVSITQFVTAAQPSQQATIVQDVTVVVQAVNAPGGPTSSQIAAAGQAGASGNVTPTS